SFVTGGYNATISTGFSSPIAGRMAWSGLSGGFITTTVNLPATSNGQTIMLRWRMASDASLSNTGWRIDSIQLFCNGGAPTPSLTPAATATATATATVPATPTPTPAPVCTLVEG